MHAIRNGSLVSNGIQTFGYTYIPKGLKPASFVINEKEAKTIRYIFKTYAKGASKSGIIRYLEEHKTPTKTGKTNWEWKNLENILKNHSYNGIKYFNTRTMVKEPSDPFRKLKYGKEVFRDKSEWIPVKVPRIVSKELFEKVQNRFKENSKRYTSPQETQLLSNLVKCGECKGSFTAYKRFVRGYRYHKGKKGVRTGKIYHRVSYTCSRRIRQKMHSKKIEMKRCSNPEIKTERLETCVLSIVKEILSDEAKLKKYLVGVKTKKDNTKLKIESQLKALEQKILKLTGGKRDILERYAKGKIDRGVYSKRCKQYDVEISKTKDKRDELLTTVPTLHKKDTVEMNVGQYCNTLKNQFKKCTNFNTKRKFLQDHIEKVIFTHGRVSIVGSVPIQDTEDNNALPFRIEDEIDDKRSRIYAKRKTPVRNNNFKN